MFPGKLYLPGNIPTGFKYRVSGEERNMGMVGIFPGTLYLPGNIPTGCKYRVSGEESDIGDGGDVPWNAVLSREHSHWLQVQG